MTPHLILFSGINSDWYIVMAAPVILVVIGGYIRAKEQERKAKLVDAPVKRSPLRDFAIKFSIGIFVAVCFWAFEAIKGH